MFERDLQNALYEYASMSKQRLITPNVRLYGKRESDLLTVSKAGFITEYEIKVSRSDFLADFRRKRKKHIYLKGAKTFKTRTPNYFYFAVPEVLSNNLFGNVPYYAGLVIVSENGLVAIKNKAPRLHNLKASERDIEYLSRGLMIRYWKTRCDID